jgi:hypothetical protein
LLEDARLGWVPAQGASSECLTWSHAFRTLDSQRCAAVAAQKTVRPQTLALWLSGGVPFIAYLFTASGFSYWLDSGEFVATSVMLDIAHPPGHPLTSLYGRMLCFLPLGSLSFRVALGQALASALASLLHCRASAAALRGLLLPARVRWSLGVLAAWSSAFTYGVWFQAVRPEVYALQTLCVAALLERLLYANAGQTQALIGAACALALALTNHHLIALLMLPACLPALTSSVTQRRWRTLAAAAGLGTLALGTYLYLPLRAAHDPPLNLGVPDTLERFAWVVSARVYAHDMGAQPSQPLVGRMLDVIDLYVSDFGFISVLVALIGLYLMLRLRATRRAGLILGLTFGVDSAARAWLGPVRSNPDILGYLAPSFLAIGSLAAGGLGALCWALRRRWPELTRTIDRLVLFAPLAALVLLPAAFARASLRDFTSTDDFDELRVRDLPPRALVLASTPQTAFRAFESDAVEMVRPDVVQVPLPFLRYPGTSAAFLRRRPSARALVQDALSHHDRVRLSALRAIGEARPVFVELDTHVEPEAFAWLLPRGPLAQLIDAPLRVSQASLRAHLDRSFAGLYARLGAGKTETETARQLLWVHYLDAIQLGAIGAREAAESEVRRALALQPNDRRARALEAALAAPGPFDPEPFLRFR